VTTAFNKKYHPEHFTCSQCATVFGAEDLYYTHLEQVYCQFHYAQFAARCHGCHHVILKQFVEVSPKGKIQIWHPDCYTIYKYWNVTIASQSKPSAPDAALTPSNVRTRQELLESKPTEIFTVLSAFEESTAACISEILLQSANGSFAEASRNIQKAIIRLEILFDAINQVDMLSIKTCGQALEYEKQAKLLCRKFVKLFSLISKPFELGQGGPGLPQATQSSITAVAKYIKITLKFALRASLTLVFMSKMALTNRNKIIRTKRLYPCFSKP
jgi:hypothetical protein